MTAKKKTAALMLLTALLSFGICESVYQYNLPSDQPQSGPIAQAPIAHTEIAAILAKTPRLHNKQIAPSESDTDEVLLQTDPAQDLLSPETTAGTVVSSYRPEQAPDEFTRPRGPLDLGLVPEVVILPKKQEPLASSGLYDKKTQKQSATIVAKSYL